MHRHFITISTALVLMLTGIVSAAEARTQHNHCKGAGTFVNGEETHIDTNGDGQSAGVDQGLVNCRSDSGVPFNNTRFFFQEEAEWILRPVTTCPVGTSEELYIDPTHGQHRAVVTDEKTGDQLFGQITSATFCVNFATLPITFTSSAQGENIGGTGKYTGATGSFESHTTGSYLIFGFKDGVFGGFGHFNFTSDGTLILPNGHED